MVTGFKHGLLVRNLLVCLKLISIPWWTYRMHKDRFFHIFHRLRGVCSPIHMPHSDVMCQLVEGTLEYLRISRCNREKVNFSSHDVGALNFSLGTTVVLPLDACAPRRCRFSKLFPSCSCWTFFSFVSLFDLLFCQIMLMKIYFRACSNINMHKI